MSLSPQAASVEIIHLKPQLKQRLALKARIMSRSYCIIINFAAGIHKRYYLLYN